MALERLITREKPETITPGRVERVDLGGRRILVRIRGGAEIWVGYDPSVFSLMTVDDDVLVAKTGSSGYLLDRIPRSRPDRVTIMTV
jgi:hypothetical protein